MGTGTDLMIIKRRNTGTKSTEVHILSAVSDFQDFLVQTGTGFPETDDEWMFLTRGADLVGIHKRNTKSGFTEIHICLAAYDYKKFSIQGPTALYEADYLAPDETTDALTSLSDVLKLASGAGTGLSMRQLAQTLRRAAPPISLRQLLERGARFRPKRFAFAMTIDGDLVAVKKYGTGTHMTEVHILSRESSYLDYTFQSGSALPETDDNWDFTMGRTGNLTAIKRNATATKTTEAHVLRGGADTPNLCSRPRRPSRSRTQNGPLRKERLTWLRSGKAALRPASWSYMCWIPTPTTIRLVWKLLCQWRTRMTASCLAWSTFALLMHPTHPISYSNDNQVA